MTKRAVVPALVVFAGLVGAAAAKPGAQPLVGVKLQGPAKSLAASCAAAPPCGSVDMAGTPPKKPDCSAIDRGDLHHAAGSDAEVWIAPVGCAVPDGINDTEREYHVFVRRGGTWWRGGVLEATTATRNDFDDLDVTWADRDNGRVVARVEATHNFFGCNRAMPLERQTTYDLVVDARAATPVVYPKLAVGAHFGPGAGDDNDTDLPDCKTDVSTTALTERWVGSDRIELSGDDKATGSAAGPHAGAYQLVAP